MKSIGDTNLVKPNGSVPLSDPVNMTESQHAKYLDLGQACLNEMQPHNSTCETNQNACCEKGIADLGAHISQLVEQAPIET